MEVYEKKIIEFLKNNGPSHPSQINNIINKDTFFSKVILDELRNSGKIFATKGKLGGSPLYYLPIHEEKAKKMIFDGLDFVSKKLVNKIKERGVIRENELSVQEKFLLPRCLDFIISIKRNNEVYFKYYSFDETLVNKTRSVGKHEVVGKTVENTPASLFNERTSFEERKVEKERKEKIKKEDSSEFASIVENELKKLGFTIINSNKKKKGEIDLEIMSLNQLKQKYYVKAKNKKRISESDIAIAFTEAQKQKLPLIFVSKHKLSKKVKEFSQKNYGGLILTIEL